MKWILLVLALLFWFVAFAAFGLSATVFGQGIAAAFVISGTVALVGFAIVDRLDAAARVAASHVHVRARSADGSTSPFVSAAPDPYAGG